MADIEKLLTDEQFQYFCLRSKPKLNMRNALYDYLVKGVALSDACSAHGIHKNSLTRKCKEVFSVVVPEGWSFKLIALPAPEMEKVEALETELRKNCLV